MDPGEAAELVDSFIEEDADDLAAVLTRLSAPAGFAVATATVRAWVRAYTPAEITPLIIQGDSKVTISPSDLAASEFWPTGADAIPRRGDQITIQGKTRLVMAAEPLSPGGVLIRINLQTRG